MPRDTVTFRIPPGWSAAAVETTFVFGEDGVESRFRAVGAADELYELAIARDEREGGPHSPRYGIVRSPTELEIGWNDPGSLCTKLVDYGLHLLLVRAQSLGEIEDFDALRSGSRFAEIRGRVAVRDGRGFALQQIRHDDPFDLLLADCTELERATWTTLATRCACPACVVRLWTAADADALAVDLERDPKTHASRLPKCMVRTPALLRAAMLAGMHPAGTSWRRARVWGPRSVVDAAAIASELVNHRRKEVRLAAAAAIAANGS